MNIESGYEQDSVIGEMNPLKNWRKLFDQQMWKTIGIESQKQTEQQNVTLEELLKKELMDADKQEQQQQATTLEARIKEDKAAEAKKAEAVKDESWLTRIGEKIKGSLKEEG
ncbi:hypothetical protein ACFLZV_07140 [Candidatus Margulisiibacteriota bacterium]